MIQTKTVTMHITSDGTEFTAKESAQAHEIWLIKNSGCLNNTVNPNEHVGHWVVENAQEIIAILTDKKVRAPRSDKGKPRAKVDRTKLPHNQNEPELFSKDS